MRKVLQVCLDEQTISKLKEVREKVGIPTGRIIELCLDYSKLEKAVGKI